MKKHLGAVLALALLIIVALACSGSFNTANISELKFGATKDASPSSTTFKTGDDVYAVATVSNASGKLKLTWRVTYEDAPPKAKGEEVGNKTMDFEGSSQLWQQFSSPIPGEYKVEATLTDESGKKLDSKSGTVKIED